MDKNLNSINQNDSFIGYDGKTYSSIDELKRANNIYENRKYAQSELPKADKDLNPINQDVPFIGRDGKTYYSLEELNRADIMFENRQIINSSLPKIAENEAFEESTVDYDTEGYHKSR